MLKGISLVMSLLAGLLLFLCYGLLRGFSLRGLLAGCVKSVCSVRKILVVFLLIGVVAALWRACGTVPAIICYMSQGLGTKAVLPMVFLLNCLVSFLTGSSFGTAGTIGVITVTLCKAMGVPAFLAGGAMLSGAFFGDRCSFVSTSALLVSTLTKTSLYENIKNMFKTGRMPFVLSCLLYFTAGLFIGEAGSVAVNMAAFNASFRINMLCLLPALLILLLALFKWDIKKMLVSSIAAAVVLALFLQKVQLPEMFKMLWLGYHAKDPALAAQLDGGGIVSMFKPIFVVMIASCYGGIFEETGMLDFMKAGLENSAKKFGNYRTTLGVAILTAAVACNQTLSIILTQRLCSGFDTTAERQALNLSDSAVIVAPLIPWSVACAVPLSITGVPSASVAAAVFLWLVPLCRAVRE